MSDVGNPGGSGRLKVVRGNAAVRAAEAETEEETLERAAARDEAAVRRLFREHYARVHRHVARVLGAGDADVEDVVQQVFLAALEGAHDFDGRSSVSTWLIGIATRRALDEARSRWRRGRWARVAEAVGVGRPAARPDHAVASRSEAEAALATLAPDLRAVFLLHEVEGHTLAEISALTGVGISTLHARLQSARKRLDTARTREGGRP